MILCDELPKEATSTETFTPVDGGVNRACRGASTGDNLAEYFTVLSANDLEGCKALCVGTDGCKGIEYHISGRCEVWTRPGGVQASTWDEKTKTNRPNKPNRNKTTKTKNKQQFANTLL